MPGLRSSYQQTPDGLWCPVETLWVRSSVSWSPKLRYARRYIARSDSESSFWWLPLCGMHVPPSRHAGEKLGTVIEVGSVKVLLPGVPKSAWNLNRSSEVFVWMFAKRAGDPAGGAVLPLRSEGRRLATDDDC